MTQPVRATFKVGSFTVEMTVTGQGHMNAEWDPHVPKKGEIDAKALAEYQKGRNQAIQDFATINGINVMVVDL